MRQGGSHFAHEIATVFIAAVSRKHFGLLFRISDQSPAFWYEYPSGGEMHPLPASVATDILP